MLSKEKKREKKTERKERPDYPNNISRDAIVMFAAKYFHVVVMLRFMSEINQPSLSTPFYYAPVSIFVLMALSTVFYFIKSPDNSPFSEPVLPVLSLPYWSF